MRRRFFRRGLLLSLFATFLVAGADMSGAYFEPDKEIKKIGRWTLHQGRYTQGCVAAFPYKATKFGSFNILIGGDKQNTFWMNVELDPGTQGFSLYHSIGLPELMFGGTRVSAETFDYRGSVSVLVPNLRPAALEAFRSARSVIYTDRGSQKLFVIIETPDKVVSELNACIRSRR